MVHQPIFKKSNDLEIRHSYLFSATRIKSIEVCVGSQDPLLIALLVGTCAIHNSIQWIYRYNPNLHLLHDSLFVCLFVCMIPPYFFACLHVFIFFFFFVVWFLSCLFALFGVLVCLFACGGWSMHPTSKRQAKGHWSVNFRSLAPPKVHPFLSLPLEPSLVTFLD